MQREMRNLIEEILDRDDTGMMRRRRTRAAAVSARIGKAALASGYIRHAGRPHPARAKQQLEQRELVIRRIP